MNNSESLEDIVFIRTAKGANASKANNFELPRPLKRLLLVVDGHSPVSKFIPYLSNLLPLSEKFAELEHLGYIQKSNLKRKQANALDETILIRSIIKSHQSDATDTEKVIVANVLREIEHFLSNSVGLEATPVMLILKKITTIDNLKVALLAYFDLIESYDIDASSHALKLENLMLKK